MLKLKMTQVYLEPTDYKKLAKLAESMSKRESRRVTTSELIRRAIREFLAKQEA